MRTILGHYVYALFRENGQPFYIGIGTGNRISLTLNPNNGGNRHKSAILRSTREALGSVPYVLLHTGLDANTAKAYEVALIAAIGRTPDGPLTNLTDGGDGIRNVALESRLRTAEKLRGNKNAAGITPSAHTRALQSAIKMGNKYGLGSVRSPQLRAAAATRMKAYFQTEEGRAALEKMQAARKPLTKEARAGIAAKLRGRPLSEETKQKMKAAWARRRAEGRSAMPKSAEHRAKLAAANLGKKQSPERADKSREALRRARAKLAGYDEPQNVVQEDKGLSAGTC